MSNSAFAHGGGLNAQGCHNNRKTGDYHCHRAPSASIKTSTYKGLSSLSSGNQSIHKGQTYTHMVYSAQYLLSGLNYDVGAIDGQAGAKTIAAVIGFQSDHKLPVTGKIDGPLLVKLSETFQGQLKPRLGVP